MNEVVNAADLLSSDKKLATPMGFEPTFLSGEFADTATEPSVERTKGIQTSVRCPSVSIPNCEQEGCDRPVFVKKHGLCQRHYHAAYRRGGLEVRAYTKQWLQHTDLTSPTELGKVLGVSRQRAHQILQPMKHKARLLVRDAIAGGIIAPPPFCYRCGETPEKPLHAHHWDYDRPLDVGWFCSDCHVHIHHAKKGASA